MCMVRHKLNVRDPLIMSACATNPPPRLLTVAKNLVVLGSEMKLLLPLSFLLKFLCWFGPTTVKVLSPTTVECAPR